MIALAIAAALSAADLRLWIDAQPQVRSYESRRAVSPPPAPDDFRRSPTLPRREACGAAAEAMQASVSLFRTVDEGKLVLVEPDLVQRNDGQSVLQLDDGLKQVLTERARGYEQDAGRYEPSCLG